MWKDYYLVNYKTKFDWYPMPMLEELFDAIGFSQVFSTLELKAYYHPLLLLLKH